MSRYLVGRLLGAENVLNDAPMYCASIDAIHKWLSIHYSFVLMQISLPSLIVMC